MAHTLIWRDRKLILDHPAIMGILNVTPNSFSDGGLFFLPNQAVAHGRQMVLDGADIIDVGGESTRPGSEPISVKEEMHRVAPVVEALVSELKVPISVDTTKSEVAEWCLKRGAHIINDVSGLRNERMRRVVANYHVPVVIMHMQGTPETMQINPMYEDVVNDIIGYLNMQVLRAKQDDIEQIIIDPGIGFGKTLDHNLTIFRNLEKFREIGYPLLVGPSRKGFIGEITGRSIDDRLSGTLAAVTACVLNGADIIRVHDVKECKDAIDMAQAIKMGTFHKK